MDGGKIRDGLRAFGHDCGGLGGGGLCLGKNHEDEQANGRRTGGGAQPKSPTMS